ncbi:MAG: hypothetical protein QOJ81_1779 [Chloroflexota bacterium]|nr:hypothetical protein [Chloroflexota bacterium]
MALLLTACSTAGPSPSPAPSPSPSPQPSPSTAFYLRAWYTQALPPRHTFNWLAMLTVADGVLLDGNVAIDMIFPGPLTVLPIARPITPAGIAQLVDEARRLGMLSDKTDYTGGQPMPGARLGQVQLIVDGVTYNLTGNPDATIVCVRAPCEAAPGTPEAFGAFWQELVMAGTWLEPELGPAQEFVPDRVALLLVTPTAQDLPNQPAEWPFDTALTDTGVEFPGEAGARCVTLSGDALAAVWPTLRDGNQLTVFVDDGGTQAAAIVRVIVPGDESPCPDAA